MKKFNKSMKNGQGQRKHGEPDQQHYNKRFEEVCEMMQKNCAKFLDIDALSETSSEEEIDDVYVLEKTCSFYGDDQQQNLRKVRDYLQDIITSGAIVCLICIESVKRNEKIWSCKYCYCILHLQCIQKWAKDTLCHLSNNVEEKKILKWSCPKCRWDYTPSEKPEKYFCFCGKVENPSHDNWSIPHSCGNSCNKELQPNCGHFCCLLCHPGPCPPCPKTVSVSCCCSKSPEINKRCSDKEWVCGKTCGKILACNIHFCQEVCHRGKCSPCNRQSVQQCLCKSNSMLRSCSDSGWQCNKVCNKPLECGHHSCKIICHSGPCPPCPDTGQRFCPCQKKSVVLPCTEKVLPCGDTCNKLLDCGLHRCSERCHYGACEKCIQMSLVKCRCGQREKSVLCGREFICDMKCKNRRDCGRHNCNRKCCPGNCPPCEVPCGKTLKCGNHKCLSFCHSGPCFPCKEKSEVVCNCGLTKIMVPCGRKKSTTPPKCPFNCKLPSDCHHPARQKHKCHFGKCPSCNLMCNKALQCGHTCTAKCHSAVLTKIETKKKIEGPWDLINAHKFELVSKPCPPCPVLVPVTCLGGHETNDVPCHQARPMSCGKPCGRFLLCGNHTCILDCHEVDDITDFKKSSYCEDCLESCQKPRKAGCSHPCLRPCHPGECDPCQQRTKKQCHCQINAVYIICDEWNSASVNKQADLLCCHNRCPKEMSCGHRCILQCHPGNCASSDSCKKKVVLRCSCKRIKKEFQCCFVQLNSINVECDEDCLEYKKSSKAEELEKINEEMAVKQQQQKKELEDYLKKSEGKKKRKRKKQVEDLEDTKSVLPLVFGILSVFICIVGIYFHYYK